MIAMTDQDKQLNHSYHAGNRLHTSVLRQKGPDCSSHCRSVAKSQNQVLQTLTSISACAIEHAKCGVPGFIFQPRKSICGQSCIVRHIPEQFTLRAGAAVRSELIKRPHGRADTCCQDAHRLTESKVTEKWAAEPYSHQQLGSSQNCLPT